MGEMQFTGRTWQVQGKDFGAELAIKDSKAVLTLRGEIDVYTYPILSKAIDDIISQGYNDLVIDFGDVTFLDSGGISVLIRAHKMLKGISGTLQLDRVHGHAYRVLEITGLLSLLNVHPLDHGIAA